MTVIRTAVIQYESQPGKVEENIALSLKQMETAVQQGAKMIVLPELCQSGYDLTPEMANQVAETIEGESVSQWEQFANTHHVYIAAGLCERDGDNVYNSSVLIGPEGHIGTYRKVHLFYREKELFAEGDKGIPVFDLGWGKVAMLICYDLRFPEAVRMAALQGAELICVPTAWVAPAGTRQWDERGFCMQAYCTMAHASMNRLFLACANTFGRSTNSHFLGGSLIVEPSGWPIAGPAANDQRDMLIADLDLAQARSKAHNPKNNLLNDRRKDLYGQLPIEVS